MSNNKGNITAVNGRVAELEGLIVRYQNSYYNGEGEISDNDFDALWDELKLLSPDSPILRKVGTDSGPFMKVHHVMPMGSQEKVASDEEFLSWAAKHKYDEYIVEYKLDGASLELQYVDGKLQRAITRGDGTVGDDITVNAVKFDGVLHTLKTAFTGGVRGEVIMTHKTHDTYFRDKANCRNAANGLMKRKDGKGCEHLMLITYDAWAVGGGNTKDNDGGDDKDNNAAKDIAPFADEVDKVRWLEAQGFHTVPIEVCGSAEDVIRNREHVMSIRLALDYDIDGLVVKERRIDRADAMRARPERQIAFKFNLEEAVTTLRSVEWSINGGTYTPVAVFDEVPLAGTLVHRASLANPDTMRALGVAIGSSIVVVKRGEIIPKVMSVVPCRGGGGSNGGGGDITPIVYPTVCEVCGTALVDEGSRLFCPNKACDKRVLHQLLKWVSVVDIRDMGEGLVTQMFESGVLRSISGIYALTEADVTPFFLNEESVAQDKKSLGAAKVLASINAHRTMMLSTFIGGFDIEGIGETMAQKLVSAGYDTLDKMLSATPEQFAAVYGFADAMSKITAEGLAENAAEMRSLIDSKAVVIKANTVLHLAGKSFCFTGELHTLKRADAEALVKQQGGSCKSSVTKDLSYLVTNDKSSGSSKNVKAQRLNIPVIDEEEFLSLLTP